MTSSIEKFLVMALRKARDDHNPNAKMSNLGMCGNLTKWSEHLVVYDDLGIALFHYNYVDEEGKEWTHAVEEKIETKTFGHQTSETRGNYKKNVSGSAGNRTKAGRTLRN